MITEKKFSIITVTLNNLEELKKTSSSILEQDGNLYEWIVIDGNSKDSTKNWLQKHSENLSHWLSENDTGIYDAMNKGIGLAKGEYLIFMNAGDRFENPRVLHMVTEIIKKSKVPSLFIYGDQIIITLEKNVIYKKSYPIQQIWRGLLTSHQAMFFHKSILKKFQYESTYRVSADHALVSKVINYSKAKSLEKQILQLTFPICIVTRGGYSYKMEFNSILDRYKIRRHILKMTHLLCFFLFIYNLLVLTVKRLIPRLDRFFLKGKFYDQT